jgi:cobalt transporter subunit CbtB
MVSQASQAALPVAGSRASDIAQALGAILLGLFVIGMVGFAHLEVVHNAAHDVRHSNAFPCH